MLNFVFDRYDPVGRSFVTPFKIPELRLPFTNGTSASGQATLRSARCLGYPDLRPRSCSDFAPVKLPAVAGAQLAHHLRQSPPSKLLHVEKRRAGCILLPQPQYFNTFFEIFSKNIPNGRFLPSRPCNYSLKYHILLEQKSTIEHLFFCWQNEFGTAC